MPPYDPFPARLIVFSGVAHFEADGSWVAHGGFVREVDLWAQVFSQVIVLTLRSDEDPPADCIAYKSPNIRVAPIGKTLRTDGIWGKVMLAKSSVFRLLRAWGIIKSTDVVMARGPDGVGFLGVVASQLRRCPRFAKYADQWEPFSGEPLGYRLQKLFYRSPRFGGPVMIYGKPDPTRPHLVPFYTSSISRQVWEQAGDEISERRIAPPYHLLFVGRLVRAKGADVLLQAVRILVDKGYGFVVTIVGDGPERRNLQDMTQELDLTQYVSFTGWLDWEHMSALYAMAHCFVHCSRKEGFGKVLLEAMTYGLPVVGTEVGVSRSIVDPPHCGLLVKPDTPGDLATTIGRLLAEPDRMYEMGLRGRERMQSLLLEDLETSYYRFIVEYMKLGV